MKINKQLIGTICRIIIGLVFILSAVLKCMSIEAVDLFFFDHKIFPWVISTILSRLLIAFEGTIGIMLIIGIFPKLTKILTLTTLITFTIYLIIKPFIFNVDTENCYCFGDKIQLSDTETIIKNIILLILSISLWFGKWFKTKFDKLILIGISLISLITVFIIIPPDYIIAKIYDHDVELRLEVFEKVKEMDNIKPLNIDKGKKVVCWYSTGCKYCKRAAKKIDIIIQRHNLNKDNFVEIFGGAEKPLDKFYSETQTQPLKNAFLHIIPFLNTTHGTMPVVFLVEDGKIIKAYKLTTIDEEFIVSFFK